ncbi:uncharacterized protein DS421_20g700080 [Arachis hypogaea]|nr:uncharacterized protein DS421_20g700080 [Arachis hypogaea]
MAIETPCRSEAEVDRQCIRKSRRTEARNADQRRGTTCHEASSSPVWGRMRHRETFIVSLHLHRGSEEWT